MEPGRRSSKTKLTMPVLALGRRECRPVYCSAVRQRSVAQNVTGGSINGNVPQSAHWLVVQHPEIVLLKLLTFL